ncbi:quinol:electron acceptor oxidoreductase subunit ActD [Malonomonas rubra]|uniref:quinol:electron acceptor oxidoreductase subunit ActD n=1 Tax=Malonomonas rubra TaxID=57040 RepID=UPI0026ECFA7D|nr:quinol:electron acceptor oxidoreductase subunit ActD [Malonomonas rubra]
MEILGVFKTLDSAAAAIDKLIAAGVTEERITSLSSVPYPAGVLIKKKRLPRFYLWTLVFGGGGAVLGFSLAAGTAWLYPLQTGDKPIISIFPVGLITYELMMLFAIIGTLVGMFWAMRLPKFNRQAYADEIGDGAIGVLVTAEDGPKAEEVRESLRDSGAGRICNGEEGA